jgi:pimeloyl-ACP methyl ester carboxylesterase
MRSTATLAFLGVNEANPALETSRLTLVTDQGEIPAIFHRAEQAQSAVLWVFGASGGLNGPAGGLYERLARQLVLGNIASLRLDYRVPGQLFPCVLDVLLGIAYLETLGFHRIVLVGHSFGGAVVIHAGALSPAVRGVAALSSQTAGADLVANLAPKPLLLVHGEADEVLPVSCSEYLYAQAGEPKQLVTYPGCHHGLDECRESLDHDLYEWLREVSARE